MLSDIYEAYAEGKIDKDTFLRKKENIREMFETEDVEAETKTAVVRTDLENLLEEVQSTADDSWLTREVLKVFVKEIWIFPESEMKIIWKPELQKLLSNNKTAMQAAQDVARTAAGKIGDGLFCQAVVGDHFLIPVETVLFHPGALLGIGLGAVHVD